MAPRGETKERILAKALESFSTIGYDGTSLDDLAESLNIRKQTILYHFVSKRGLLNAVLDDSVKKLTESLEEVLASTNSNRDRIEDLVRSVFRVALEQPLLLGLLREVSRPGSPAAPRLKNQMTPLMSRAIAWMEEEMESGRMRRTDAQLVLLSAYSTVVGLATEIEILRTAGVERVLRPAAQRRQELLSFLRASLTPLEKQTI
ncbi:MAG: Biofilm operon icaADBC HTH-type negative transcriptional regulator IcaR [Acidimicrobiales bacterium AG-410-I20]|nr:MAG: Biofilm operon icaADBC HTH-type negative transcriptional regulator IcaR [Acidimicrobiales bacterium AG-410-I20]